jgi:hypothetical protein
MFSSSVDYDVTAIPYLINVYDIKSLSYLELFNIVVCGSYTDLHRGGRHEQ